MDYKKCSIRELNALLKVADSEEKKASINAAIEAAKKAREESGSTGSKINYPKVTTLFGSVQVVKPGEVNTLVGIRVKGSSEVIFSELSPKQLANTGGQLAKGDLVSVQCETLIEGVTQYKDANGDVHTHKGSSTRYGLVSRLTEAEIANIERGW